MRLDLSGKLKYQSKTNIIRQYYIICAWPTFWRQ